MAPQFHALRGHRRAAQFHLCLRVAGREEAFMREDSRSPGDKRYQPGILDGVPPVARFVLFNLSHGVDAAAIKEALTRLTPLVDGSDVVVGVGPSLVKAL